METDITAIDERLKELLGPLAEEEETLEAEKTELTARLTVVNGALQRVRRVKAVAFPEPRPTKPKVRERAAGERPPGGYVSDAKLAQITEFLQSAPEPISVGDTARTLNISEPTVSKAFATLREQEVIRIAGKNAKNAKTYAFMSTSTK